ncbi:MULTISPECIES: rod shape-determining protein RodA [Sphingobacterium]|uniref:Cell wall polymerase n=1 Tax=Sphingobacterium cellulitidis TaxID=1768011 RepID=A0A8H9KZC0_9SPHI|nr:MULTISPECIES: rod shape-determining protein RodA [Sphingobacterium]MBA8988571.1 rod shape determining protein RodA [Sphingobacterium soli]OYD43199.1 rod shape-determining protein RodA [Sphingobacterium cellulitidis]OYD47462.1 rod shape-determining protein RodA [Sphingobacterium cellulitidis]WFB62591.1 rod shape-determining protein RodA [Sphingobacterium sp. WM]GGE33871.1 rod shape-determining protein RodA [Sphingobacterium soli]
MNNLHKKSFFGRIDWLTIGLWLALCLIGWFNIHAAVYDPENPGLFNLATNYGKQSIYIFTALIIGICILIIDSRFFISSAPIIYIVVILLLVAVLVVGRNVGGNQAWIPLGSFRLQPSEFGKLATCLLLAYYLSNQTNKNPNMKTLFVGVCIVLFPVALVMLQPDTGSALAFFSLVFVFYREGYVSTGLLIIGGLAIFLFVLALLVNQWILIGILALVCGFFAFMMRKKRKNLINMAILFVVSSVYILCVDFAYEQILQPHQRNRIDIILGKMDDPKGQGYNLNQSMIAIGSGQLFGKGYLQGTQTKYNFVPEQSTDFIFCTVGEEWGFVGSVVLISLYVALLVRLVNIAERQRTAFARIYAYGVASILFFHFFINIGMTIGIVPVIGIPLPFISYGGSSLWSFTILLFILLRFDSARKGIGGVGF